jgi:predicted nucleic acid-binding protein
MVIDTSILIDHLRKINRTHTYFAQLPPKTSLYVSAITVYELLAGATDLAKRQDAQTLLATLTILPIDEAIAAETAALYQSMKGNSIGLADMLIAATVLHHNLPLKTLNAKHFSRVAGLVLA